MIDYQKMTDEELDKRAAEMVDINYLLEEGHLWERLSATGRRLICANWQPTHKDSNQIQWYLFPKVAGYITEERDSAGYYQITIDGEDKNQDTFQVKKLDCHNKINRTIVIACLEAWDKLNR